MKRQLHDVDVVIGVDQDGIDRRYVELISEAVVLEFPRYRVHQGAASFREHAGGGVHEQLGQLYIGDVETGRHSYSLSDAFPDLRGTFVNGGPARAINERNKLLILVRVEARKFLCLIFDIHCWQSDPGEAFFKLAGCIDAISMGSIGG